MHERVERAAAPEPAAREHEGGDDRERQAEADRARRHREAQPDRLPLGGRQPVSAIALLHPEAALLERLLGRRTLQEGEEVARLLGVARLGHGERIDDRVVAGGGEGAGDGDAGLAAASVA